MWFSTVPLFSGTVKSFFLSHLLSLLHTTLHLLLLLVLSSQRNKMAETDLAIASSFSSVESLVYEIRSPSLFFGNSDGRDDDQGHALSYALERRNRSFEITVRLQQPNFSLSPYSQTEARYWADLEIAVRLLETLNVESLSMSHFAFGDE